MNKSWLSSAWQLIFITGALFIALMLSAVPQINALGAGGIVALVNAERGAVGLAPLNYNGALASSAYAKAQDMLAKGYWAHTSPDGLSAWTFMSGAGYPYIASSENLARDFGSDGGVVAAWMGSAGHRANMLSGTYRDIGVAVASGALNGVQTTIVVAHFGATSAAPAPAPVPQTAPTPAPAPRAVQTAPATRPSAVASQSSNSVTTEPEIEQADTVQTASEPALKEQSTSSAPEPKKPVAVLIESLVKIIEPGERALVAAQ